MSYLQPSFLFLFVPIAIFAFYVSAWAGGKAAGLAAIVAASLLFYLPVGWFNFALLATCAALNYVLGALLLGSPVGTSPSRNKWLHGIGQVFNFSVLIAFKYIWTLNEGVPSSIPPGISFYSFQLAVFLLGCYHQSFNPEHSAAPFSGKDLLRFGSFALFFPRLLIGPIVYRDEFLSQVDRSSFGKFCRVGFEVGIFLIVVGLFKKVVIADRLGTIADPVFLASSLGKDFSTSQAWAALLAYYAQLYFDFSGYTDIALGLAKLFGVRLPVNFDSPLKACGIVDFYRRWHITLTRVVARFVFTELSLRGARYAMSRGWMPKSVRNRLISSWIPLLLNFEIIALWHGLNTTYIVFGLAVGLWYVIETEAARSNHWKSLKKTSDERIRYLAGFGITTCLLIFAFALFRSPDLASFGHLMVRAFALQGEAASVIPALANVPLNLAVCYAIIWLMPNSTEMTRRYQSALPVYNNLSYTLPIFNIIWRPNFVWLAAMLAMIAVVVNYYGSNANFIYLGF